MTAPSETPRSKNPAHHGACDCPECFDKKAASQVHGVCTPQKCSRCGVLNGCLASRLCADDDCPLHTHSPFTAKNNGGPQTLGESGLRPAGSELGHSPTNTLGVCINAPSTTMTGQRASAFVAECIGPSKAGLGHLTDEERIRTVIFAAYDLGVMFGRNMHSPFTKEGT